MSSADSAKSSVNEIIDIQATDRVVPFDVPTLDVRGRIVEMGATIDTILARHAYPEPVGRLLAQTLALTALLGSSLKFDGKFIVQAQTEGPISLIIADYRPGGALRGYARFDADNIDASQPAKDDFALLGKGVLALTIDQGDYMQRYQGLVSLDGSSFEQAAKSYFRQSEQLPTEVRLSIAKSVERAENGDGLQEKWRAGGIIVQFLPDAPDRIVARDLPGGDNPANDIGSTDSDDDKNVFFDDDDNAWREAQILTASTEDSELTDPHVGAEKLLYRLFHEQGARMFEPISIRDECSCTRERIREMLGGFSEEDLEASIEDGRISVDCEFCSTHYEFVTEEL